jgi:hypothetical protein
VVQRAFPILKSRVCNEANIQLLAYLCVDAPTYPLTNGQLGLTKNTVGISFSQIHFGMTLRRKKRRIRCIIILIQLLTITTT